MNGVATNVALLLMTLSRVDVDLIGDKMATTPRGIEIVNRLKRRQALAPIGEADASRLQQKRR